MYWSSIDTNWEYGVHENYATIAYVEGQKYHDEIIHSMIFLWETLVKKKKKNLSLWNIYAYDNM